MPRRFFVPVEREIIASYARFAGAQAARAGISGSLEHAVGLFVTSSFLLTPLAGDDRVMRFIRIHFKAGWREALAGQEIPAPCGWRPKS